VQIVRGMLFAAFILPVLALFNGSRKSLIIIISLYYGFITSTLLLMPTPFMPFNIRMGHLPEIFISMIIMGYIITSLLTAKKDS